MDFFLTKLEDCFISTITAVFPPHCSDAESRRAVMKHISRHSVDIILYCLHYCQFSISVLGVIHILRNHQGGGGGGFGMITLL